MANIKEIGTETVSVSMNQDSVQPPCWFACNGQLYLAVEWIDGQEVFLRAVWFSAVGPHRSTWKQSDQTKVDLVQDSGVSIYYRLLKKVS